MHSGLSAKPDIYLSHLSIFSSVALTVPALSSPSTFPKSLLCLRLFQSNLSPPPFLSLFVSVSLPALSLIECEWVRHCNKVRGEPTIHIPHTHLRSQLQCVCVRVCLCVLWLNYLEFNMCSKVCSVNLPLLCHKPDTHTHVHTHSLVV